MKRINMDFDIYEEEMKNAKRRGITLGSIFVREVITDLLDGKSLDRVFIDHELHDNNDIAELAKRISIALEKK